MSSCQEAIEDTACDSADGTEKAAPADRLGSPSPMRGNEPVWMMPLACGFEPRLTDGVPAPPSVDDKLLDLLKELTNIVSLRNPGHLAPHGR